MNYLAHIALSGDNAEHRIGGFLGDFVRGPLRGEFPEAVEAGIQTHRKLDAYLDTQPEMLAFLALFESPLRRYAGIVADVIFDHCLANCWSAYYSQPLDEFCGDFYSQLQRFEQPLPPRAAWFSTRAPQIGWLESYGNINHMPRVLNAIGARLRRPVALETALDIVEPNMARIEADFHRLYPRLQTIAQSELKSASKSQP